MLDSRTAKQVGITVAISDTMQLAIRKWIDMYKGNAPWLTTANKQHLGLPAMIASEMATIVTLEASVQISGSPRADWLAEQCAGLLEHLRLVVEYACAEGGIVLKPYVDGQTLAVDIVHADDFYPISFNSRMEITGAVFVEHKRVGDVRFARLEVHQMTDQGYRILNRAFRGAGEQDFTQEIALTDVEEWASLQPEVSISNVPAPLFGYLRIPLGNTIDPKSPVGVSVYEKACGVIEEADKQYQRLLWEYEGGELAIDAVEDAFDMDPKTKQVRLPVGRERLFRPNRLDPNALTGDTLFKTFSPALRDTSYLQGLNKLLQRVEDLCGFSRGTLSDPNDDARSATEIKATKQRTYATVTGIQRSTQKALEALVQAMDTLATLYQLCPAGKYEVASVWDDSIVVDAETERLRDMSEVRERLMMPWEYRVKWRGETEEQAKAALADTTEQPEDALLFGKTV
ncbi:MAG: phage portal protein [Candidatus Limiplasma sp.]|nr:phage portal protein [Candidatus Limiplasma sp.]